ncbi:MAG: carboxy-S-adenosyl-L-methionine synthase CmoA [Gammaproteobacteria bacterium]|nr:carboxy-S-adenosyl-L-methionine synthase CmoA [Gammaproteobacteria bacterium]
MPDHDPPPLSSTAPRDELFATPAAGNNDFRFDQKTAAVFDDMVTRSVPLYDEIQRTTCELAADFAVDGSNLYDLGCSTATTLMMLDPVVSPGVRFVGVDNSPDMITKARSKVGSAGLTRIVDFKVADLHDEQLIENASVVVMILTLQFIRPLLRERVVQRIYDGLNDNGCLILVEKQTMESSLLNRLFIRYYYDLKARHGYSAVEIAQKREALENVLIPYRPEENRALLHQVGFRHVEETLRWYNFAAMVAVKAS